MKAKHLDKARNPLLSAALVAIRRAARRAREEALRTHTRIVVLRSGSIERVEVQEMQDSAARHSAGSAPKKGDGGDP